MTQAIIAPTTAVDWWNQLETWVADFLYPQPEFPNIQAPQAGPIVSDKTVQGAEAILTSNYWIPAQADISAQNAWDEWLAQVRIASQPTSQVEIGSRWILFGLMGIGGLFLLKEILGRR